MSETEASVTTPGAVAFLAGYAARSGTTPDALLEHGRVVASCSCDYAECEGWQLINESALLPWRGETVAIR